MLKKIVETDGRNWRMAGTRMHQVIQPFACEGRKSATIFLERNSWTTF
jgi:hypothetical protein